MVEAVQYDDKVSKNTFEALAVIIGRKDADVRTLCEIAGLSAGKDFEINPDQDGKIAMTTDAANRLRAFVFSAGKMWTMLGTRLRMRTQVRRCIRIQSLMRVRLAKDRTSRMNRSTALLGDVALLLKSLSFFNWQRRAAVRIQAAFRMHRSKSKFDSLIVEVRQHNASVKIQALFRILMAKRRAKRIRQVSGVSNSIACMQKCMRSFLAAEIVYQLAVQRRKTKSANMIRSMWLMFKARKEIETMRGFKVLAVHAKFVTAMLAFTQVIIARYTRGWLCRLNHPKEVAKILFAREDLRVRKIKRLACVKIQSLWKGLIIRRQCLLVKSVTVFAQNCIKTTIAIHHYN